jgi:hypothetical protein
MRFGKRGAQIRKLALPLRMGDRVACFQAEEIERHTG